MNKRETGRSILQEIMGPDFTGRRDAKNSDFNEPLNIAIDENCFGDVWTRPGLDRRTRSLVLIGVFVAMGRASELANHVRGAINNGASAAEIQEVLYQMTAYCGLPAAAEGFRTAEATLIDMNVLPSKA